MELTREVTSSYEEWLRYPVKITADPAYIERYIDFDNPGLPVRDYRFHPKLKIVSPEEISSGYQPTRLEQHYSGELRAMAEGTVVCQAFHDKVDPYLNRLAIYRMINYFRTTKDPFPLTKAAYRQAFIRIAEVEIQHLPGRYELWDNNPETYLIWIDTMLEHVEVRASQYGDIRLRLFGKIVLELMTFCARRCGSNILTMDLTEAENLLVRLKRLDIMLNRNIFYQQPLRVTVPAIRAIESPNLKKREIFNMKTNSVRRAVYVDTFGNFRSLDTEPSVDVDIDEELTTTEPVYDNDNDNGLVSLNTLNAQHRIFRLNDAGEYEPSLTSRRKPQQCTFVDGTDAFEIYPHEIVTAKDQPTGMRVNWVQADQSRVNVNMNIHINGNQVTSSESQSVEASNDNEDDDGDYQSENYYRDEPEISDDDLIVELLEDHEKVLCKLEKTNPSKRKKSSELTQRLKSIELQIRDLEATGTQLPYKYRKQTMVAKAVRYVKWGCRGLWENFLDNMEPILTVAGILFTIIKIGANIYKKKVSI